MKQRFELREWRSE